MSLEVFEKTDDLQWEAALHLLLGDSFFCSSNWANVLRSSYSYKPLYFTWSKGPDISAIMPAMEINSFITGKRGVSLPFSDYCEPVVLEEDTFSEFFNSVLEYGKVAGWKYFEIRGGSQHFNNVPPYCKYLRHVLKIHDDESVLFAAMAPSTRRNIRKAVNSGVRVSISDLESDLASFYRLHCLTRKRHCVPPQPYRFFRAIYREIIAKGMGFTALATWQGKPIAGAVFFYTGQKGLYKFGASDLTRQHLRANNLVMWKAIQWFSQNGFTELCFGRTDPDNTGLLRFKKNWNPQEEVLPYYRYDFHRSAFIQAPPATAPVSAPLRRLPVPVLRLAGLLLYGHMG